MTKLYDSEDFTGSVQFGATWPRDAALGDWGGDVTAGDCGGDLTVGEGAGGAAFFFDASNWARKCLRKEKRIFVSEI